MELEKVDFDLAKRLNGLGFPVIFDYPIYCKRDCEVLDGDYWKKYKEGDYELDGCNFNEDDIMSAPTYELVAKWLRNEKNIDININVCHIFATIDHRGYTWEIMEVDKEKCEAKRLKGFAFLETTYEGAIKEAIYETVKLIENERI